MSHMYIETEIHYERQEMPYL